MLLRPQRWRNRNQQIQELTGQERATTLKDPFQGNNEGEHDAVFSISSPVPAVYTYMCTHTYTYTRAHTLNATTHDRLVLTLSPICIWATTILKLLWCISLKHRIETLF